MTRPPLFPHQVTALEFLRTHPRAALFLDMVPCPIYSPA